MNDNSQLEFKVFGKAKLFDDFLIGTKSIKLASILKDAVVLKRTCC